MSHGNTLVTSLQHATHATYDETVSSTHRGVAQRCCDTGRPVASDPVTGRTICSCQLQSGAQTYLSRVPTLPEHIYGPFHSQLPQSHSGMGQPAFYSMDSVATDRRTDSYTVPPAGHVPYYYDQLVSAHPYAAIPQGFDFNAARRKNATRETTGPLKAWLNGHRKNPYPTKGEKVMLAIITRMTLTQVSTWFANARRRLKKDNVYGEDDYEQDDKLSNDDSVSSQNSLTEEEKRPLSDTSGISDISDADIDVDDVTSRRKPVRKCVQRLFSPDIRNDIVLERIPTPDQQINTHKISEESANIPVLNGSSLDDAKARTEPFLSLERLSGQMVSGNLHHINDNRTCDTFKHKENVKRKFEESDSEAITVNAAKKPKIWSISEIIG